MNNNQRSATWTRTRSIVREAAREERQTVSRRISCTVLLGNGKRARTRETTAIAALE